MIASKTIFIATCLDKVLKNIYNKLINTNNYLKYCVFVILK